MFEIGKTYDVLVNRVPQKWTPLREEYDPCGYNKRVVFRVDEEGKKSWVQVIQRSAFMRRIKP